MTLLVHLVILIFSAAVVWFFAGLLISAVDRVAHRFHQSGFSVAFFVLGLLTSISEISVAFNSTLLGVPEVSVGNLVGASFVVLLLIIPLLAIWGNGIELKKTISRPNILLAFAVIVLPALLILDGQSTPARGLLALLAYLTLVYAIHRQNNTWRRMKTLPTQLLEKDHPVWFDFGKILAGGLAIFIASHFLVEQSVYFATVFTVPAAVMGLLLLSVGTNVPELVIAARSIVGRRQDIAFGDYLGSASANTLIFGVLALANGSFSFVARQFLLTTILLVAGLVCLYFFTLSQHKISRHEGLILISFYFLFFLVQIASLAHLL